MGGKSWCSRVLAEAVATLVVWTAVFVTAVDGVGAQQAIELPAEDRALTAGFEEIFRVGSLDGEEWETFGEIGGTAFDAAGNLYVLDRQASHVTVVDRDGGFVRTIGQPGEGPGEFRMPLGFTALRDGRLVVSDLGHRAYQLFGADGAFDRMVGMGADGEIRVGDLAPDPAGGTVISGGGGAVIATSGGPGDEPPATRPIDRISLDGDRAEVTTVVEAWMPPRDDEPTQLQGGGVTLQMSVAGPRVFEPALLVGVLTDGSLAFVDSSAYNVKVVSPAGALQRVLRRPFEPRPVTPRMEEAERERRLQELEEGGGPRMRMMVDGPGGGAQAVPQAAIQEMIRGQIAQLSFYPELPVLMDLRTTWDGRLWAQRRGDAPTDPGPIDVLTPGGDYLGTYADVVMPDAFGPDGLAAWVEEDDFGVPVIVVRRLPDEVR